MTEKILYIPNVRLFSLLARSKLHLLSILRLYYYCRKEKPVILQTYLHFDNLLGILLGKLTGTPLIITGLRAVNPQEPYFRYVFARFAFQHSTLTIANSQYGTSVLRQQYGLPQRKVLCIPNGKDFAFAQVNYPLQQLRKSLRIPQSAFVITVVAKLRTQKGHTYLLEAIAQSPQLQKAHFLFVGGGPCMNQLRAQAKELGIAVQFLGDRTDVPAILAMTDLFVMPSLWEGMPGALMEAMAMGVPVLATAVGGTTELIAHGKTGYLVLPRDAVALSAALQELMHDAQLRKSLGQKAKAFMLSRYRLEPMIQAHDKLYASLIRGAGR